MKNTSIVHGHSFNITFLGHLPELASLSWFRNIHSCSSFHFLIATAVIQQYVGNYFVLLVSSCRLVL